MQKRNKSKQKRKIIMLYLESVKMPQMLISKKLIKNQLFNIILIEIEVNQMQNKIKQLVNLEMLPKLMEFYLMKRRKKCMTLVKCNMMETRELILKVLIKEISMDLIRVEMGTSEHSLLPAIWEEIWVATWEVTWEEISTHNNSLRTFSAHSTQAEWEEWV